MSIKILLVLCLAAVCAVLAVGCAKGAEPGSAAPPSEPVPSSEPTPPSEPAPPVPGGEEILMPGGTTDATDPNAPKSIESTEITSFECTVSLLSAVIPPEHSRLVPAHYAFSAKREGDRAVCSCAYRDGEKEFTEEAAFLDRLQQIVSDRRLAEYNGVYRWTHGLPDDFGYCLKVQYASGEKIYAQNNQSMELPLDAVGDLVELFGAFYTGTYYEITQEEAVRMMEEAEVGYFIVDVRTQEEYDEGHIPGAVCVPMESILAGEADRALAPDQLMFVYCRSGRRSKIAAQRLADAGYTNVYEFGGILDWAGEIEKD